MIKVTTIVATKEEDCRRILTVNEEFYDKKLEEYSEKMEFLLNEFMKNKEAQDYHEEILTQQIREKEEKISFLLAQVQEFEA